MSENNENLEHLLCSFCGESQNNVSRLIASPNKIFICDSCVKKCNEIISDNNEENINISTPKTPKEMYELLDQYIIGQNRAKKVLSVGVYNHYKRIWSEIKEKKQDEVEIQKLFDQIIDSSKFNGPKFNVKALHSLINSGYIKVYGYFVNKELIALTYISSLLCMTLLFPSKSATNFLA